MSYGSETGVLLLSSGSWVSMPRACARARAHQGGFSAKGLLQGCGTGAIEAVCGLLALIVKKVARGVGLAPPNGGCAAGARLKVPPEGRPGTSVHWWQTDGANLAGDYLTKVYADFLPWSRVRSIVPLSFA